MLDLLNKGAGTSRKAHTLSGGRAIDANPEPRLILMEELFPSKDYGSQVSNQLIQQIN